VEDDLVLLVNAVYLERKETEMPKRIVRDQWLDLNVFFQNPLAVDNYL
jgi:hypothetical protein